MGKIKYHSEDALAAARAQQKRESDRRVRERRRALETAHPGGHHQFIKDGRDWKHRCPDPNCKSQRRA